MRELPSSDEQSQGFEVSFEDGPQGGGHPVVVPRVAVLSRGFFQQLEDPVPGRPFNSPRAISEQFQSNSRAVLELFQISFRAVLIHLTGFIFQ